MGGAFGFRPWRTKSSKKRHGHPPTPPNALLDHPDSHFFQHNGRRRLFFGSILTADLTRPAEAARSRGQGAGGRVRGAGSVLALLHSPANNTPDCGNF